MEEALEDDIVNTGNDLVTRVLWLLIWIPPFLCPILVIVTVVIKCLPLFLPWW